MSEVKKETKTKVETTKKPKKETKTKTMKKTKEETKTETTKRPKKETKAKTEIVKELKEEKNEAKVLKKETKKSTSAIKEVKKVKENALLNDSDQVKYKALCKVVKILSKIGRIILMIVVPFIFVSMILIPIVFKNFQVEANIVKFDDLIITVNEEKIVFKVANDTYAIGINSDSADRLITFLSDNSKGSIITYIELSLLLVAIVIILNIYLLSYLEKLFTNFVNKNTPFVKENTNYIFRIAVILSIIKFIDICLSTAEINTIKIESLGIIAILVIYVIYFIFKYAVKLQEKDNSVIYD